MKITIDGQVIEAKEGQTILEAARDNGIYIPALCWHPRLTDSCVEIEGRFPYADREVLSDELNQDEKQENAETYVLANL